MQKLHLICILGCASAVANAQTFGNTTPFETQSSHAPDYVLGVQVIVTQPITLQSFGVMYGHPDLGPSTSNGMFALYDSAGSSADPLNLIASTGPVLLSAVNTHTVNFTTHPVINAGTYWMMALYEGSASPRMSTAGPSPVRYWSRSYNQGFDAVASNVQGYDGQNFNYWINGSAVPEPGTFAAMALGAAALLRRRRR